MMTLRQLRALLSEAEARLGPNAPAFISPDGYNALTLTLRVAHPSQPGALVLVPLEAAVYQPPKSVEGTGASDPLPQAIPSALDRSA